MRIFRPLTVFLIGFFCLAPICKSQAGQLTVFAAASLSDVMKEIAKEFEKKHGENVIFNFAGSSTLARQIEEGAPADVFISADNQKMDRLQQKGLIIDQSRVVLLSNSLVVIALQESLITLNAPRDLLHYQSLAIADPQIVPAGIYARKFMESAGIWKSMRDKIIPTDNVRGTLAAVESGNVEIGIVYKTDALISKKVKVIYQVPQNLSPKIEYPAAIMKASQNQATAARFLHELQTKRGTEIFQRFGFIVPSALKNSDGQKQPSTQ